MTFRLCCLLWICATYLLTAQTLTVTDAMGDPIPGANVFTENFEIASITNLEGEVDISAFAKAPYFSISHLGHLSQNLRYPDLAQLGYVIVLQDDTSEMETVVISASRFEQRTREVPQKIVAIDNEEIARRAPQTAADLLDLASAVFIQKSQLGGGSPMIRGFSTNRLLLNVDGVRMNNAIFRSGNVQNVISIDPFAIDRTEVILGPGSMLYGSDAVGGVMSFSTLRPRFSRDSTTTLTGNAAARYATASNERTGHADFTVGLKKWSFVSSVSFSLFDDLRMGRHGPDDYLRNEFVVTDGVNDTVVRNDDPRLQVSTGYDQINLMQKVAYRPNERFQHGLTLIHTATSDYPRYDRLIRRRNGNLRSAEWYYGPQIWTMAQYKLDQTQATGWFNNAVYSLSYQRFEESRNDRDLNSTILAENDEAVDAVNATLDFEKKYGDDRLYYGAAYVYNKVHSEGRETDVTTGSSLAAPSRYPDGSTYSSLAAYASYKWKMSERAVLQGGARYNYVRTQATFTDEFFDFPFTEKDIENSALTGTLGLAVTLPREVQMKANLSTAFRAPNIDDVGKIFDSEPGSVVVPNPGLKPEYAYSADVSVSKQFDSDFQVDAAVFYTLLDDALVRRDFSLNGQTTIDFQGEPSQIQAIQNAGMARSYGFELGMRARISPSCTTTAQLAYVNGEQEEDDGANSALRHAAPLNGNLHLIYEKSRLRLDAFLIANGEIAFQDLAITERNKPFLYAADENGDPYAPSWYTLNLAGSYNISNALTLVVNLENLTDQRYRTYSSGIAAAGRNLVTSLLYSF